MWWVIALVVAAVDLVIQVQIGSEELFRNVGVGFGLLPGIPVWLIVVFFLLYAIWIYRRWGELGYYSRLGISLIGIGGLSNVLSRAIVGGVVDYLAIANLRYNLADLLIIFGLVVYSITVVRFRREGTYVKDSNSL